MLAYGTSADQLDELVWMDKSAIVDTEKYFCKAVTRLYGAEYLRSPNANDLRLLMTKNKERGFPGMIGSIDCMHWT